MKKLNKSTVLAIGSVLYLLNCVSEKFWGVFW